MSPCRVTHVLSASLSLVSYCLIQEPSLVQGSRYVAKRVTGWAPVRVFQGGGGVAVHLARMGAVRVVPTIRYNATQKSLIRMKYNLACLRHDGAHVRIWD